MIVFFIDTTKREEIKVGLGINGKHFEKKSKSQSDQILSLIDKLLKEKKIKLNQLDQIKVNIGPGSFTGIRIGISVANALGFALKIPVNGKIGGELNPMYTD